MLLPKGSDASGVGWCAGLVKPNGRAEPPCEVHLLSIRSLDESMNLSAENRKEMLLKTTRRKKQESQPGRTTWKMLLVFTLEQEVGQLQPTDPLP